MAVEIRIPHLGESVTEGIILRWLKRHGDTVRVDEPVLELETDKASLEIPATASGRLEIVESEGSTVRVGTLVARVAEGATAETTSAKPPRGRAGSAAPAAAPPTATPAAAERKAAPPAESDTPAPRAAGRDVPKGARTDAAEVDERGDARPATAGVDVEDEPQGARVSPAVPKLVAAHQLDPSRISPTGKDGQLTEDDVRRQIAESAADRVEAPEEETQAPEEEPETTGGTEQAAEPPEAQEVTPGAPPEHPPARPAAQQPGPSSTPDQAAHEVERKPMSRLRRRIAERLVEAQRTAAILTTFNEIDLARLLAARQRHRERFRERHGVDLGLVSLFGRACILALADVPILNARIDGDDVVYHRHVHLGIAVSTPRGLVVPVVRHAERLSLAELEGAIDERARLAREAKLTPDHLAGGTFTISNGGVFGSLLSTPILNPPQSGILGMHKIEDRPVAVDRQVVIRPMMYVALSYDHRLVDGEQAVTFLVRVKERLEDPVRMLLEV